MGLRRTLEATAFMPVFPCTRGLICVDAPGGLNLERQKRLFDLILSNLIEEGDLTNQVLEVVLSTDGSVELIRFKMPPS